MKLLIPFHWQQTEYTCGPAVLRMVFSYVGMPRRERTLARKAGTTREGTSTTGLVTALRQAGFTYKRTSQATWRDIKKCLEQKRPTIIHYREPEDNEGHYAVVTGYKRNRVILNDPWHGRDFKLPLPEFKKRWIGYENPHRERGWMLTVNTDDEAGVRSALRKGRSTRVPSRRRKSLR